MQGENVIFMRGLWPLLPVAERVSESNSKLVAFGVIPLMDRRDEDYRFTLEVHTADPAAEQAIAGLCSRAVTSVPRVLDAMRFALEKLESVDHLKKPGDTNVAKQSLAGAIVALTGEECATQGCASAVGGNRDVPVLQEEPLELADLMLLIGHASALRLCGEVDMPIALMKLARKLAASTGDESVMARVAELEREVASEAVL